MTQEVVETMYHSKKTSDNRIQPSGPILPKKEIPPQVQTTIPNARMKSSFPLTRGGTKLSRSKPLPNQKSNISNFMSISVKK
jgi:hypothetical protein